jgi:tetratricopeptide (TPR) repeat protein
MCNSGQYPEAIQYYLRTIALDKLHDPAYYNLGYVYHMTK